MPPPPLPPASAMASRFADHWAADVLAGDESLYFNLLQALLGASPEPLAGAPEATRERVALRSLQEVSSLIPAGADAAAAAAGVPRVDGARSCEDALSQIIREVAISGKLEKDLLPPFSRDIQETMRTKKFTLPETSFQLLKGVDPWILHQPCTTESRSYIPPQEDTMDTVGLGVGSPEQSPIVEGNISVGSVLASAGCDAPLQGSTSEPFSQQDKHEDTAAVEPKSCGQKSPDLPHCADGEGADDGGSSNQPSKVSREGLSAHATVTPDFDASEPRHLPECITAQDTTMISSQPDSKKAHLSALQHERGEKVNQDLEDVSASVRPVEKDHAHEDLSLESVSSLLSKSCNGANQGSNSKTDLQPGSAATENRMAFEEQNANKPPLEVSGANKASPALHNDGSIMKTNTVHGGLTVQTAPEISVHSQDEDIDDTLEGLCIKCGQDGELVKCGDCSLAAHESCFGSLKTFGDTNLLYCPVCFCKRAKKAFEKEEKRYLESRKYADAFRGTAQVSKQHDEQLNGVQPGAANRDGNSNGCDTSKRNRIHQNEACDLARQDGEPHQVRKKRKINAGGNGYPKEVLTEKVPFENCGPDLEKKQQAGDKEARKEPGNGNSSHKRRASSPPSNHQDGEADQEENIAV